jgi:hypothetical protein
VENLNRGKYFYCSLFYLITIYGCANSFPYQISSPAPIHSTSPASMSKEYVSGEVVGTDRQSLILNTFNHLPMVIVFAQDTCTTCRAETLEFRDSLAARTREPSQIKLVTILVGATADDAVDWKETNQVPWTVAIDGGDLLFRRYCGGGKVPCTLVQLPDKGIVLQKVGASSVAEIKEITGDWEK